jgi:hypothetical protein
MPREDRCPLNPSFRKSECSHCQRTGRGTRDNPIFSIREDRYQSNPVVVILKDGAAIHAWDSYFGMGTQKVRIALCCIEVLRDFWIKDGYRNEQFFDRTIVDPNGRLRVQVFIAWHRDFERSDGEPVDKPFLHLRGLPPDSGEIGLGVIKCRAIYELREELRDWLHKHSRF